MVLLNEMKLKYEDGKIWLWRETSGNRTLKNPDWWELKGCVRGDGYRLVGINNKQYLYHRVVYYLHNKEWAIDDSSRDNYIDHIDRNKLNNSIENLRVVTHTQNQWNRNGKGYYFRKGKYAARIIVDGEHKHLGLFVSEDEAHQAYLNAKAKHHVISCLSVPPPFEPPPE